MREPSRTSGAQVQRREGPSPTPKARPASEGSYQGPWDMMTQGEKLLQLKTEVEGRLGVDAVDVAQRGVQGGGSLLPHYEQIQASFGRHDVSDVRAHVGGAAGDAARSIGAVAYATGNDVAFAQAPDLFTVAHEAAHVVQQSAGVQLKGGVGQSGDLFEQHADRVAAKVVRGESAEPELDLLSGGGGAGRPNVQREAGPGGDRLAEIDAELDATTDPDRKAQLLLERTALEGSGAPQGPSQSVVDTASRAVDAGLPLTVAEQQHLSPSERRSYIVAYMQHAQASGSPLYQDWFGKYGHYVDPAGAVAMFRARVDLVRELPAPVIADLASCDELWDPANLNVLHVLVEHGLISGVDVRTEVASRGFAQLLHSDAYDTGGAFEGVPTVGSGPNIQREINDLRQQEVSSLSVRRLTQLLLGEQAESWVWGPATDAHDDRLWLIDRLKELGQAHTLATRLAQETPDRLHRLLAEGSLSQADIGHLPPDLQPDLGVLAELETARTNDQYPGRDQVRRIQVDGVVIAYKRIDVTGYTVFDATGREIGGDLGEKPLETPLLDPIDLIGPGIVKWVAGALAKLASSLSKEVVEQFVAKCARALAESGVRVTDDLLLSVTSRAAAQRPVMFSGVPMPTRMLLGDGPEVAAMRVTGKAGAGMAAAPRHHVFPQEFRKWFEARGFTGSRDIDNFTLELDEAAHQALHGGGNYKLARKVWPKGEWNGRLMAALKRQERLAGRQLTYDEIQAFGQLQMKEFRIEHLEFVHFKARRD